MKVLVRLIWYANLKFKKNYFLLQMRRLTSKQSAGKIGGDKKAKNIADRKKGYYNYNFMVVVILIKNVLYYYTYMMKIWYSYFYFICIMIYYCIYNIYYYYYYYYN